MNQHNSANARYQPGTIIDQRYEIVSFIGSGGMGEVYRAKDVELNNHIVALKVLRIGVAEDEVTFSRLRNEVLIARTLIHPNIVRIFDLGKTPDGQYYISMEAVGGRSLAQLLEEVELDSQKPTLPFVSACGIFAQLLDGVAYAHQNGIVHRDLKPGNVLITEKNEIKLLDFGIAKLLTDELELTKPGQLLGTPLYMAPEQVRGENIDLRCDVYSLGIIGYELVTGENPFQSANTVEALFKQLNQPLPTANLAKAGAPKWFAQLITKASSKDRADRFSSAEEFSDALRVHFAQRLPYERSRINPKVVESEVAKKKQRKAAAAFLALLLAVGAAAYFSRLNTQRPRVAESPAWKPAATPTITAAITATTTPSTTAAATPAEKPATAAPTAMAVSAPAVSVQTPMLQASAVPTSATQSTPAPNETAASLQTQTTVQPAPLEEITAQLSVREATESSPETKFNLEKVTQLRWVAAVTGVELDNVSAESVKTDFRLELFPKSAKGQTEKRIATAPVNLLSVDRKGAQLRVGGSLGTKSEPWYKPGEYVLMLTYKLKEVSELSISLSQ